jgi:hypothetical protein
MLISTFSFHQRNFHGHLKRTATPTKTQGHQEKEKESFMGVVVAKGG